MMNDERMAESVYADSIPSQEGDGMKIVLAPDSYKGTLTAVQVCETMERGIREELPDAEFDWIPMADGGEGTLEVIVNAADGQFVEISAAGPFGQPIRAQIGRIRQAEESWAVIESARLFGLPMLAPAERNPLHTTSRGLGDAIRSALDLGFRKMVIGLGGSSTNDGGMGMLAALGARFADGNGEKLFGFGRDLAAVEQADLSKLDARLAECTLIAASDVTNPLLGAQGATRIYGPQKGADPETMEQLERAMARYANMVENASGVRCADAPGAGAAGGLGFALLTLGARIQPGTEAIARLCGLADRIKRADCVVTGEGSSDAQTLYGKLPIQVAKFAAEAGKPVFLLSGSLGDNWPALLPYFSACLSTVTRPAKLEECLSQAEQNLYAAARNLGRLLAVKRPGPFA